MEQTVTEGANFQRMDWTVSLSVTVMLHTVIMSMAVYSL